MPIQRPVPSDEADLTPSMAGDRPMSNSTPSPDRWLDQIDSFVGSTPPDSARAAGARVVSDVLAATVAGSRFDGYLDTWSSIELPDGPSTVLGTARTTDAISAAGLNGTAAISQEIEEGHNTGGHVGAGIVVGGFAAAEAVDASGRDLVDAVTIAYEICTRLEHALFSLKAMINDESPWLIRNPHSTWTTVGPALAASLVIDPEGGSAMEAFLLGANRSVVSMYDPYREGPPDRNVTSGASAATGVFLSRLARAGLPGSPDTINTVYHPFEDILPDGFEASFDDLGARWSVTEAYFKPYPSCRYTHAPLDALCDIDVEIDPATVTAIEVATYANAVDMANKHPTTPTGAKFSIPYVLATYLHRGIPTFEDFLPESIADPAVQATADLVELSVDDDFERRFPEDWGARVCVTVGDGSTLTAERRFPRGDHREPIDDDAFADRLATILSVGLDDRVDEAVTALLDIETDSAREVGSKLRP